MEKNKKINSINIDSGVESDGQYRLNIPDEPEQNIKKDEPVNDVDELFKKEKTRIAEQYKILNSEKLTKKEDGQWYIDDMKIEEYHELTSNNDNRDMYDTAQENAQKIKDIKNFLKNRPNPYNPLQ